MLGRGMDDYDTLAQAKATLKKAAASQMMRIERLQGELMELEAKHSQDLANPLISEAIALKQALLAELEMDLDESKQQLREIDGLKDDLQRAGLKRQVNELTSADPFSADPVDRALENVREHIQELDARAEVMAELAGEARSAEELRRKLASMTAQERDAAARAQLEELKAARKALEEAVVQSAASKPAQSDDPPPPPTKPKRTM